MRWVPDAIMILRANETIDWQRILDFAVRHRVGKRIALGLSYLCDRFDADVPGHIIDAFDRQGSPVERLEVLAMRGPNDRSAWRHLRRVTYVMRLLGSDDASRLPQALATEIGSRIAVRFHRQHPAAASPRHRRPLG
jgi:hypothetical protein